MGNAVSHSGIEATNLRTPVRSLTLLTNDLTLGSGFGRRLDFSTAVSACTRLWTRGCRPKIREKRANTDYDSRNAAPNSLCFAKRKHSGIGREAIPNHSSGSFPDTSHESPFAAIAPQESSDLRKHERP